MSKTTIDITMPSLGSDMRDGTLVEWEVAEGDKVSKGDIIAVIETNKGAIDMECYHSGTISQLLAQPVISLPVGTVLAKLEVDDLETSISSMASKEVPKEMPIEVAKAEPQETTAESLSSSEPSEPALASIPISTQAASAEEKPPERQLVSPVVRKLAQANLWDLSAIAGSGPNGAILLRDVQELVTKAASAHETGIHVAGVQVDTEARPVHRQKAMQGSKQEYMREAIATAMEKSKREIPHYYLLLDIDLSKAVRWLHAKNAKREPEERILLLALLLRATAAALTKFPALNGYYQQNHFEPGKGIHIGNAISLRDGGLVIPAIHDVDQLSLEEAMQALRDVTKRSRTGHLRSSELTDATITVTSIGDRGSDSVFGVIYPPQVAIVGFGRLRQSANVVNGEIGICDMITVTLSADHRVSDGTLGAKFLHALSNQLQKPESL